MSTYPDRYISMDDANEKVEKFTRYAFFQDDRFAAGIPVFPICRMNHLGFTQIGGKTLSHKDIEDMQDSSYTCKKVAEMYASLASKDYKLFKAQTREYFVEKDRLEKFQVQDESQAVAFNSYPDLGKFSWGRTRKVPLPLIRDRWYGLHYVTKH